MSAQPIKIAILAIGGEGGGVLADWIVDLAEHSGWLAQATSVPGVAQRTGATIYYIEMIAPDDDRATTHIGAEGLRESGQQRRRQGLANHPAHTGNADLERWYWSHRFRPFYQRKESL
jgi:hypothetical protein